MKLLPKYTYTNYYQKEFRTERARRMVKLITRYISHSFHCKFSDMPCIPRQYSRIPLQLKYSVQNLTTRAKFGRSLKTLFLSLMGMHRLMCSKNLAVGRYNFGGPRVVLRRTLCVCVIDYMASKDIINMNEVFRARTEAAVST